MGGEKPDPPTSCRTAFRITPAWAGKSEQQTTMDTVDMDHPRMGGEKLNPAFASAITSGSPPRRRGKGKDVDRSGRTAGITPA